MPPTSSSTGAAAASVRTYVAAGKLVDLTPRLDADPQWKKSFIPSGGGPVRLMWSLALPLSRASLTTVSIYSALQAWNGFLFPLVLTQSEEQRVQTLGLWNFQNEFASNVPGLMAAVLLSALPVFVLCLFARRWLVAGLASAGGK